MLEESIQMLEREVNASNRDSKWVARVYRIIKNLSAYVLNESPPRAYVETVVIPLMEEARASLNSHYSGDNPSYLNITEEIAKLRNPKK